MNIKGLFKLSDHRGLLFCLSLFTVVLIFAFPVAKTADEIVRTFGSAWEPVRIFSEEIKSSILMAICAVLMLLLSIINYVVTPAQQMPPSWIKFAYIVAAVAFFIGTMSMYNSDYMPLQNTFSLHLCRLSALIGAVSTHYNWKDIKAAFEERNKTAEK